MVAVTKTFIVLKNFCSDLFAVRRKPQDNFGKTVRNFSIIIYCVLYLLIMLIFILLLDVIDECNQLCNQAGYMEGSCLQQVI